jgi:hypothetical protein
MYRDDVQSGGESDARNFWRAWKDFWWSVWKFDSYALIALEIVVILTIIAVDLLGY